MAEAGPSSPRKGKDALLDFDELLKRTVKDKRLSGTNVQKVSDLAIRSIKHDVRLVASINKLHRSLPARSPQKIHSLYTLHSIAGAVKKLLNRYAKAEPGTDQATKRSFCENFLGKLEGIVGGITDDMLDVEGDGTWTEGREKMRKIGDIWRKEQVFSAGTIATIQDKLKKAETRAAASEVTNPLAASVDETVAGNEGKAASAAGTRGEEGPVKLAPSPPPPLAPNPANFGNLLDILAAAGKNAGQGPPATGVAQAPALPTFAFDPNQLSALAQIAAATQQAPAVQSPSPNAAGQPHEGQGAGVRHEALPPQPAQQQSSYEDAMAKRDAIARRLNGLGPGPGAAGSSTFAAASSMSRPHPAREPEPHSRSRPDDTRYPPHGQFRGQDVYDGERHERRSGGMNGHGRRSASPQRSPNRSHPRFEPRPRSPPRHRREPSDSGEADMQLDATPPPRSAPPARPAAPQPTLATFDMTAFNPGEPASWERLGKAWENTHGKLPNEMELMMYVMNGGNAMAGMGAVGMAGMGL